MALAADDDSIMPKMKASERVMALPELVDLILANLDFKRLFLLQRVSKSFQRTIQASHEIKKAMLIDQSPGDKSKDPELYTLLDDPHFTGATPFGRFFLQPSICSNLSCSCLTIRFKYKMQDLPSTPFEGSWRQTRMITTSGYTKLKIELCSMTQYADTTLTSYSHQHRLTSGIDATLGGVADEMVEWLQRRDTTEDHAIFTNIKELNEATDAIIDARGELTS